MAFQPGRGVPRRQRLTKVNRLRLPPVDASMGGPQNKVPSLDQHPIWEEADLSHIFDNNRRWVEESLAQDPNFFQKLKHGQQPQYLYIGCSGSRVPAQEIMGLKAGEVFVTRNVGNLVVNTDLSMLSVLEYAIHVLGVKDIFVVGHYGCSAVNLSTVNEDHGLMEHWLRNIRDVWRLHKDEMQTFTDPISHWDRLVELNVQEQCINLFANPIVQRKQAESGLPRIHGFVYDGKVGLLEKLDINFKAEIRKNKDIYRLYDFFGRDFPDEWGQEEWGQNARQPPPPSVHASSLLPYQTLPPPQPTPPPPSAASATTWFSPQPEEEVVEEEERWAASVHASSRLPYE